ncbi:MAG: heavy-metal-associated domain-containing protein [Eubacteriales bacterium]|nr:heavy-metal-associated domain-containing protein [Eubacteriales bacterium]
MEQLSINVPDMSCPICADKIKSRLDTLEGIMKTNANMQSQTLDIEYEPEKIKPQEIIDEVAALGHQVTQ